MQSRFSYLGSGDLCRILAGQALDDSADPACTTSGRTNRNDLDSAALKPTADGLE